MMTLRFSPSSPFVRKIRIAASVLGLEKDIKAEPAETTSPSDTVRQQNPLGKIRRWCSRTAAPCSIPA